MRLYFEATLFGDNPFDMERHGPVKSREETPIDDLEAWAIDQIRGLRYYVTDDEAYASEDEARDAWAPLGTAICTAPDRL